MKALMCTLGVLLLSSSPLRAADGIDGTWKTEGQNPQTYIFKVVGTTFSGLVCGPCDDPASVFRIEDGKIVDAERVTFSIRYDVGGPLFPARGPHRAMVTATLGPANRPAAPPSGGNNPATTLVRVVGDTTSPRLTLRSTVTPLPPRTKPSPIEGRWVANGRVHQQNFILKVRDNTIWGLVCGPCDPGGVFMIDDGTVDGSTMTFYINHIDTPPSPTRTRVQRNIMRGSLVGNVMKYHWVREGAEDQPGGDMILIGPIRE